MWLFLIKTIVTAVMFYLVFCFYGNINNGLFLKGFFCVIFMLFVYWIDIYRLTKIFSSYYLARRYYANKNYERAFTYFQHLLDYSFAPCLPFLAIMRFKGLGCDVNAETAKYFSERALRNGYNDCLFLVALIDFFGDSLTSFFQQKSDTENNKDNSVCKSTIDPDYASCAFHLTQYIEEVTNGKNKDGQYLADAYALLGYCNATGLGTSFDLKEANKLFTKAQELHSPNVKQLMLCLETKQMISGFCI